MTTLKEALENWKKQNTKEVLNDRDTETRDGNQTDTGSSEGQSPRNLSAEAGKVD